jgi:hypothetical protein
VTQEVTAPAETGVLMASTADKPAGKAQARCDF